MNKFELNYRTTSAGRSLALPISRTWRREFDNLSSFLEKPRRAAFDSDGRARVAGLESWRPIRIITKKAHAFTIRIERVPGRARLRHRDKAMSKNKSPEPENGTEGKPQFETPEALLHRLGANIQRLRKQQGLTNELLSAQTRAQAALGQSRLVDKKTIIAIEAGKVDPSLTTVHAIARALGVPIDVLVS